MGNYKYVLKIFGYVIVMLSVIYLVKTITKYMKGNFLAWTPKELCIVFFGSLLYSASLLFLIAAWSHLIKNFGIRDGAFLKCYWIYARSQIAKYLPGNIFHYAGRHVLGRMQKWDSGAMTMALFLETSGLIISSVFLIVTGVTQFDFSTYLYNSNFLIIPLGILLGVIAVFVFGKKSKTFSHFLDFYSQRSHGEWIVILTLPFVLYLSFFVFNGLLIYLIYWAKYTDYNYHVNIINFISILSLSWLIGFITPGSPGGLGVRETVMVAALGKVIPESAALELAIIFRLVSIAGDVMLFMSTYFTLNKCKVKSTG
ncbi:hypothetical protein SAMN02745133_00946 [Desulforamulus putei DSM 12395]|uniref:Lysylphosphatidylglycerol synthase TM region n=1 Tax=Desulforamulus putei DSM 12395 TaxID=1121429 RepID=A0A1M4VII5_9FIRM|nr:lysylphosphatidylglycerol synthase domain-containing protein [Desulforamulus putei]SHE68824.1 hypothetical protein SAMN02745133_00946 [Desulforamulus putei DSM 12395]